MTEVVIRKRFDLSPETEKKFKELQERFGLTGRATLEKLIKECHSSSKGK